MADTSLSRSFFCFRGSDVFLFFRTFSDENPYKSVWLEQAQFNEFFFLTVPPFQKDLIKGDHAVVWVLKRTSYTPDSWTEIDLILTYLGGILLGTENVLIDYEKINQTSEWSNELKFMKLIWKIDFFFHPKILHLAKITSGTEPKTILKYFLDILFWKDFDL